MFITVIYQDNKMGLVDASELDELIYSNKIKQFRRSEGWVTIGLDPIRRSRDQYGDQNRRRHIKIKT